MTIHPIAALLLAWYSQNARRLPWRESKDPYAVWVSEIMLQQTRVETVIPYYKRWMERFPNIEILANSDLQEALIFWEGLGYYSRARCLHKTAGLVLKEHNGIFPSTYENLIKLPGIGPSSAADILSVVFGLDYAAMDGNIKRVVSRLYNITEVLDSPEFLDKAYKAINDLLPHNHAGDFNQAMMDLGATVCLPKNPICSSCPLVDYCEAHSFGVELERPTAKLRKQIPRYTVTAGVIMSESVSSPAVLLAKRPSDGLLGGMWEYPGGKVEKGELLEACLRRELLEELGIEASVGDNLGIYRHAYTHFRVILHAFFCQITKGTPAPLKAEEIKWVKLSNLGDYPMGKIDRLITKAILDSTAIPIS
jgi:A/G-specific adenine glycosylase